MKVTAIGVDLANRVFQVQGVDERGHVVVRKQLRRDQVAGFFANVPGCLVGMEACGHRPMAGVAGLRLLNGLVRAQQQ
jgi:transposase